MNRIDYTKLGGFPVTQFTFDFMQKAYSDIFAGFAKTFGDLVILNGCEVAAGLISDGWMSWNGEIIPFKGGGIPPLAINQFVVVEEVKASRLFQDNNQKEIYTVRFARIGNPGILLGNFDRLDAIVNICQRGDIKDVFCTALHITDNFDGTGLGKNKRKGWAICNGNNGTPNLGQRVTVGYDPAVTAFNLPGKTGGTNTQSIEKQNLPAARINIPIKSNQTSKTQDGNKRIVLGEDGNEPNDGPTLQSDLLGDGIPLNIMQAYTVTLKIMKL